MSDLRREDLRVVSLDRGDFYGETIDDRPANDEDLAELGYVRIGTPIVAVGSPAFERAAIEMGYVWPHESDCALSDSERADGNVCDCDWHFR